MLVVESCSLTYTAQRRSTTRQPDLPPRASLLRSGCIVEYIGCTVHMSGSGAHTRPEPEHRPKATTCHRGLSTCVLLAFMECLLVLWLAGPEHLPHMAGPERRRANEYLTWLFDQLKGPVYVDGWEARADSRTHKIHASRCPDRGGG